MSSVVRKLYYDRYDRITHLPRVVIGTPDSWDRIIFTSTNFRFEYEHSAWSPCGRFLAARTRGAVKIWNRLTFELLTTLRPTEPTTLRGPLAYSPDGRCIVCSSSTTIIIWDIQTGGVAKEVECSLCDHSLVWSLDGRTVGFVGGGSVYMYEVVSGTLLCSGAPHSGDEKPNFLRLWAHETSFRAVTVVPYHHPHATTVNVFEVGRTLIQLRSFTIIGDFDMPTSQISFSPITSHVSISSQEVLRIFGDRDSNCLLEEPGGFYSHCFSADGSLVAASDHNGVVFWKYTSASYVLWRKLGDSRWAHSLLQFSPTLSSVLGISEDALLICRLHDRPTDLPTCGEQYTNSRDRVAAAYDSESTITILDVRARTPSQFIDTGVEMTGLVIIGNVLMAMGSGKLIAWLLTKQGLVDGLFENSRVDHSHSIWTVPWRYCWPTCRIVGKVGGIGYNENALFVFHTETGELLLHVPQDHSRLQVLNDELGGERYLCHSSLPQRSTSPQAGRQIPPSISRRGWVEGPEGRCRLWIPSGKRGLKYVRL